MSSTRCIAMVVSCLAAVIGHAETQFPYEITVGPAGLDARCGPGAPFYITDRLPPGTKIEVYRREEGGWLAIRPPVTACSWVRKSDLRPTAQAGVAEVIRDDTLSCIGSNRTDVRDHLSYVSLHRGELVQLLEGAQYRPPASLGGDWQAIAPPAGEFRWVFVEDLKNSGELPESERPIRIPPPEPVVQSSPPTVANVQPLTSSANTPASQRIDSDTQQDAWQAKEDDPSRIRVPGDRLPSEVAAAATPTSPSLPRVQGTVGVSGDTAPAGTDATVQPLPVLTPLAAAEGPSTETPDGSSQPLPSGPQWTSRRQPLPGELSELESELALMVARPMNLWRLSSLRERTTAIIDRLPSGLEKVHAQGLLERIASFEQLQNRYVETGATTMTGGGPAGAAAGDTISVASRHYDGTGWLMPVHASHPIAPPYALLDSQGDVIQYVTPTPGLNLYRYVKQKVGIYGQRSYMPSLKKPHVVAERVIDLDRHFR